MQRFLGHLGLILPLAFVLAVGPPALASGEDVRDVVRADATGVWLDRSLGHGDGTPPAPAAGAARAPGIVWHISDADSVVQSVAVADTVDDAWVAQELNKERLTYLQRTGDGTPIYEVDLIPENPDSVAVACARDISRSFLLVKSPAGVSVRAFSDVSGTTPLWTYTFDPGNTSAPWRCISASDNGSIVAASAHNSGTNTSTVVILDGATGVEQNRRTFAFVNAVELCDHGSRAVVSEGQNAYVIETGGMTTLFNFTGSGAGNVFHRISGNGKVAAAGGFLFRAYRDTGSGWELAYEENEQNQWYGFGLAISGDGTTMMAASYDYSDYLTLTFRVIDLVSGTEIGRTTTTGTGSLQDIVSDVQASQTGDVFVASTWGTEDNAHPEILVFDRNANIIGGVDTPGSMFSVDLTSDGRWALGGGKAVHANTLGRGMDTYSYLVLDPVGVCGVGGVNVGCGVRTDVLFVNGETGGVFRTKSVGTTDPVTITIEEPPVRQGDGQTTPCCVYAWLGEPGDSDVVAMPKNLGTMCFGPLIMTTRNPKKIWNSLGYELKLGSDNAPGPPPLIPDNGSFALLSRPSGIGFAVTATFQGIIRDACSVGTVPFSVTNGWVLKVQ